MRNRTAPQKPRSARKRVARLGSERFLRLTPIQRFVGIMEFWLLLRNVTRSLLVARFFFCCYTYPSRISREELGGPLRSFFPNQELISKGLLPSPKEDVAMHKIIAGVGSRQTPSSICAEMITVGEWCQRADVWVRSGRAPGADQAFEAGAQDRCIVYLPWNGFEPLYTSNARTHCVTNEEFVRLYRHAAQFHPTWARLSPGARKLIARDSAQVVGVGLDSPVAAVVCWTKDGEATGGTGQAIRIARASNIPVLNMYRPEYRSASQVIVALQSLLSI